MKLTDLDPHWVSDGAGRSGTGVLFNCPCGCESRCGVPFANPIDGGPHVPWNPAGTGTGWQRTGDTFETLTLTPSILRIGGCGWHGFITNGEIITV